MLTNAPKGTKDILPDQVHKWHYVEGQFRDICRRYGFKEVRTPVLNIRNFLQGESVIRQMWFRRKCIPSMITAIVALH